MLKKFLDKYDTVIFDMDGVMTSEQNYWSCAALTVWEYLNHHSGKNVDARECMERLPEIRRRVFCGDKLIAELKGRGVNSNWDLGYVTVLISWITGGRNGWGNFEKVLRYAQGLGDNILDEFDSLADKAAAATGFNAASLRRNGVVWETMHTIFQEWYLGDELMGHEAMNCPGKSGLLFGEEPIVDKDKLIRLVNEISQTKRTCIGTGRPEIEMLQPLRDWGIIDCFAKNGLCSFDDVMRAEESLRTGALTKPHPYMFLKALYGTDYDDAKLVSGDYDRSMIEKTLIIGDAGADILAAKAMGADFCAVLTGVTGEKARGYFEELGAEYILKNVLEMGEYDG